MNPSRPSLGLLANTGSKSWAHPLLRGIWSAKELDKAEWNGLLTKVDCPEHIDGIVELKLPSVDPGRSQDIIKLVQGLYLLSGAVCYKGYQPIKDTIQVLGHAPLGLMDWGQNRNQEPYLPIQLQVYDLFHWKWS
jgi:hypothetical protein